MAFKIGNKIAITDNSVFNVTDTSDSDGGIVDTTAGNITFDVSSGSVFKIPYAAQSGLREKLTITNWPEPGESKKISVIASGRGPAETSLDVTSMTHNASASLQGDSADFGPSFYYFDFKYSRGGRYFFYNRSGGAGINYIRRNTLNTRWRPPILASTYDQNVQVQPKSSFGSPGNMNGFIFNDDGTKIFLTWATERDYIEEFSLSSAYDVTSTWTSLATYDLSLYTTDTSPALKPEQWANNGYILVLDDNSSTGTATNILALYLSTPYDLSTIYDTKTANNNLPVSNASNMAVSPNGDKIYQTVSGTDTTSNILYEHTLSTAFDFDTISASYSSYTYNLNPGHPTYPGLLQNIEFVDSGNEIHIGVYKGIFGPIYGAGTLDAYEIYSTNIGAATRTKYLWDSDKIYMLNDSAPPLTDSSEEDYFEFLVFDSATGAFQTEFINNV
jgi:hypothetical protein